MNVILSVEAENDLGEIYDYSVDRFGLKVADKYVSQLVENFDLIAQFPESAIARNELTADLRTKVFSSHVIFFKVQPEQILIIRILHQSRDLPGVFE